MAYWEVKLLVLTATPDRHKSQPTGFSGRRDATIAPTAASITTVALPSHQSKMWVFGWDTFRAKSKRLRAVSVKESAHKDHASLAAARALIPATPCSCSLASTVTTPLYNTSVSQALREGEFS